MFVKNHLNFLKSILKYHCILNSKIILLFYNVLSKDFYFITHNTKSQNIIRQQIHFLFHKFRSALFFRITLIHSNMLSIRIYVKIFSHFYYFVCFDNHDSNVCFWISQNRIFFCRNFWIFFCFHEKSQTHLVVFIERIQKAT